MILPKNYSDFLQSIKHYDVGELGEFLKSGKDKSDQLGDCFKYFSSLMPASYILDYTTGSYIFGTDPISKLIDKPVSYFMDGGVEFSVGLFHKKDLKVYGEKIMVNNIKFLKQVPVEQHSQFVFKCNYRITTPSGNFKNILQQSIFIRSSENGLPLATLGFLQDISHYRIDSRMIQSIEPLVFSQSFQSQNPLLSNVYFADEKEALLTEREIEVMKFLCDDLTSEEIGKKLGISRHTVDTYRRNLILKTNSKTVAGVISHAFIHGYI